MFGSQTSAMQRLYKHGNRNLQAISKSEVAETLVNVLAENTRSREVNVSVIEAISASALFEPNAAKIANMGVLKDLVHMIAETKDFRSYAVRISIEAIWNIIEVGGTEAIITMATSPEIVIALRKTFERVI